ncbi:15469_t:CDS:2, partial [Gigaspora rosea]
CSCAASTIGRHYVNEYDNERYTGIIDEEAFEYHQKFVDMDSVKNGQDYLEMIITRINNVNNSVHNDLENEINVEGTVNEIVRPVAMNNEIMMKKGIDLTATPVSINNQ